MSEISLSALLLATLHATPNGFAGHPITVRKYGFLGIGAGVATVENGAPNGYATRQTGRIKKGEIGDNGSMTDDTPDAPAVDLSDLADRYRPTAPLAAFSGRGRRPPRWDDPRVLSMLGHLEAGAYLTEAIHAAGLPERSVMRWMSLGRDEDEAEGDGPGSVYWHIWQAITRAQAVPAVDAVQVIRRAAERRGGWRAAAWLLERRYPDTWGPRATAWERERVAGEPHRVTPEEVDAKLMRLISGHREAAAG